VPGESTSQIQSGATENQLTSGFPGNRSFRHPARSGTRRSSPSMISGSNKMIQPPDRRPLQTEGGSQPGTHHRGGKAVTREGRGVAISSPSMICPIRCSGRAQSSSYVALVLAGSAILVSSLSSWPRRGRKGKPVESTSSKPFNTLSGFPAVQMRNSSQWSIPFPSISIRLSTASNHAAISENRMGHLLLFIAWNMEWDSPRQASRA